MDVGMTLNEGVRSFKHISLQYAFGFRMVPVGWRETFSEFKRETILQRVLRSHEALNSTQSSSKRYLHFTYTGSRAFGLVED